MADVTSPAPHRVVIGGSGGSAPPTPRQLFHARHPLYPVILGVSDGLIPTEGSEGKPEFCGDPQPCPNTRPLQKKSDAPQSRLFRVKRR